MRSDGALSQTESYEGGKIMKMSEVEFSSREECPVREVCYARNCGDPDHCIFANLSEADLDIEVDEYLRDLKQSPHGTEGWRDAVDEWERVGIM